VEFKTLQDKLQSEFEITTRIATFPITADTESDFTFFLIYPSTLSTEKFDEAKKLIEDLFTEQNVSFFINFRFHFVVLLLASLLMQT
jgi:hypothetical protein